MASCIDKLIIVVLMSFRKDAVKSLSEAELYSLGFGFVTFKTLIEKARVFL